MNIIAIEPIFFLCKSKYDVANAIIAYQFQDTSLPEENAAASMKPIVIGLRTVSRFY